MYSLSSSTPDPFALTEYLSGGVSFPGNNSLAGLTWRSTVVDPAKKNLFHFVVGSSNSSNILPTLYTPTNAAVIHHRNIYDGGRYSPNGPVLGCSNNGASRPGNYYLEVADKIINAGDFDVVELVNLSISGTLMSDYATGVLSDRVLKAIRRLAYNGVVPGMAGVKFVMTVSTGPSDGTAFTSAANYTAAFNTFLANARAAGFPGNVYVNVETWDGGNVSATIAAAQAALPNGADVRAGGNLDTLGLADRQADLTHFNDTGGPLAATLAFTPMHAGGY